jgi:DNA-binding NtrC family response regulator
MNHRHQHPTEASPTSLSVKEPLRCLIVEDDRNFAEMLSRLIRDDGGLTTVCEGVASAQRACEKAEYDLVLLDNRLPDGMGSDLYPWLSSKNPHGVIVVITGVPELDQAVELTRNGLFGYLTKPLKLDDFTRCLERVRHRLGSKSSGLECMEILGESPAVRELRRALLQAARHPAANVFLTGETGTGKDLAARVLHRWTHPDADATHAFVALNCAAVPGEMFEAELFGSEKGSYTGSDRRRTGLVEAAGNGTLFLDEIVETPLLLQAKLLRFLESREYRPLGTTQMKTFGGRVVAATNRSLEKEVAEGRFREDLMYRLDMFRVRVPPLRERLDDLELLAENLLDQLCTKYERPRPHLRDGEIALLRQYPFPGNIRELRNLLERSLLKTSQDAHWLALDLDRLQHELPTVPHRPCDPDASMDPRRGRIDLNALESSQYQIIAQTLREERGGIRRAATRLGITHQALLRRLEKWPELRQRTPTNPQG